MKDVFTCLTSNNVLKVDFHHGWDHGKYYQALFNATGEISKRTFNMRDWALVINWQNQLIQIPEEERIFIRSLQRQVANGLTTLVNIIESHPVAEWQLQRVASCSPEIKANLVFNEKDADQWLVEQGYNTDYQAVPFEREWLASTREFEATVAKLGLDPAMFVHRN